jgi:hypothetical protein
MDEVKLKSLLTNSKNPPLQQIFFRNIIELTTKLMALILQILNKSG